MNYIKILCISLSVMLFCAWNNPKTVVVFNSKPITTKTIEQPQNVFKTADKIHYAILSKKGFRDSVLKIQIIKKDDKSEFLGYKPILNRSVELNDKNFYIDYFSLHQKGHYIMQVFELKNLQNPVGYGEFWVVER